MTLMVSCVIFTIGKKIYMLQNGLAYKNKCFNLLQKPHYEINFRINLLKHFGANLLSLGKLYHSYNSKKILMLQNVLAYKKMSKGH